MDTPVSENSASTNVALLDGVAYVARSTRGIERIDLAGGVRRLTAPPEGVDRIDDLAVADGLLFALDATPPGHLLVYRIVGKGGLERAALAEAEVGPFSGVSALGGHVVVSGGTSRLSLRRYRVDGQLDAEVARADFGRGQPDVALAAHGSVALVSTHVQGPRFGLTVADIIDSPLSLRERGYVELPGAGFTEGGFHPANFPLQAATLGDEVFVVHGGGLSVLSASTGRAPTLAGMKDLSLHATAIAVDARRRLAFVAGASPTPQLLTLDVSNPRAPRIVERTPLPSIGSPSAIAFDATHLVVAMQDGGVHIQARNAPPPAATHPETSR